MPIGRADERCLEEEFRREPPTDFRRSESRSNGASRAKDGTQLLATFAAARVLVAIALRAGTALAACAG
jgi:hypothetical protein